MNTKDKYFSIILAGYTISILVAATVFFTLDIKIVNYLIVCFVAWCGGVFAKAIWDFYHAR